MTEQIVESGSGDWTDHWFRFRMMWFLGAAAVSVVVAIAWTVYQEIAGKNEVKKKKRGPIYKWSEEELAECEKEKGEEA